MIAFVYDIIYLISLSLIPTLWAVCHTYEGVKTLPVFLVSFTVSSVILIFIHLKNTGKIILGGSLITIAAASAFLLPVSIKSSLLEDHPWLIMGLVMPAIVTVAGKVLCSFRFIRPVISVILAAALAYVMFRGIDIPKAVVAFAFLFMLCTFADEIQTGWKKLGKVEAKKHLVFISPFLVLFLILMLIFPAKDEPYDWALAKKIAQTAYDNYYRIKEYLLSLGQRDSADSFLGFSEYASIGDGSGENDKKVLEVTQITGNSSYAYLAGKTFDTFENLEWKKTYDESDMDSLTDCLETLYAARLYSGDLYTDYIRHGQLDMHVLNMYTTHYFTPHKYYNFMYMSDDLPYVSSGGDPFSEERMTYGDMYSAEYFRLNTDSPEFEDFLESETADDENEWLRTQNSFYLKSIPNISFEELEVYRERMDEVYLSRPDISPELKEYLDEFFEDCTTDAEKLKKLEKLFNSMRYNIRVGAIPDDVDTSSEFLDYLIFEKQEGYCVYYASAFVLISRYIGIPSRFVQGYRIELHNRGSAVVTENCAHAWPECYIKGVGWIAYEPTPGFRMMDRWKTSAELSEEKERVSTVNEDYVYEPEVELPDLETEEHEEEPPIDWRYPALIAAVSLSAAFLLLIMIKLIGRIRYALSSDEKKYVIYFTRNMKLLKIAGLSKPDEETFEEFGKRAEKEIPRKLLAFIDTYEAYAYRGDDITGKDVDVIHDNNRGIIDHIKKTGLRGRIALMGYYLFLT
ncbi:MAG: transglutaminase-like domain-containing protein [Lachnospiraceae bacterium]|nr:transglutaminase-like domain-containing protein [Lachnospiraceae bacterium]